MIYEGNICYQSIAEYFIKPVYNNIINDQIRYNIQLASIKLFSCFNKVKKQSIIGAFEEGPKKNKEN